MTDVWVLLAALGAAGATVLTMPTTPRSPGRVTRPALWWGLPVLVVLPVLVHGRTLVLAAILGGTAAAAVALSRRDHRRKRADDTRRRVVEACEALASELRAGQPPPEALDQAAGVWSPLGAAVAASRLGAEVPDSLRALARTPGAESLEEVAAAWQVAQQSGAGLARAVDRCADAARGALAGHRIVAAELSSAQATARMIVVLPVLLLVLSDGNGAESLRFLTGTDAGLACLGAGLALALTGLAWIDHIVTRVGRGP